MRIATLNILVGVLIGCVIVGCMCYLFTLIIKALKAYINSKQVREEKAQSAKSLGEVLKAHRTNCKMTQEFVAEHLGVSRQTVSKWESGASDPSTSNLITLAKLFEISPEDLLKEARQ